MVYLGATHTAKTHGGHKIYLAMYVVLPLQIVIFPQLFSTSICKN